MGINGLWAQLKDSGVLDELKGLELIRELEGKAIALDISTWMIEGHTQKAYGHQLAHVKVRFWGW